MKRQLATIARLIMLGIVLVLAWGIVSSFIPIIFHLLGLGLIFLLLWGMLSPFESLGWWAGWSGQTTNSEIAASAQPVYPPSGDDKVKRYVVYLSGIGAISGDFLYNEEIVFLDTLSANDPGTMIVKDVFPYAMNNNGLTGQRFFASLWRLAERLTLQNNRTLSILVNLRNMFQVAVCADRRYGPFYNYGTAEAIRDGLFRQGYQIGSNKPVTLIGYSGGGQIALGSANYLKNIIKAPLQIISLGGVMADDPGLEHIDHLYHLYGSKDPVQKLGAICYAGRWPILPYSPWNQAKAQGKITMIPVGPVTHNDPGGYFQAKNPATEHATPQGHILEVVSQLIENDPVASIKP